MASIDDLIEARAERNRAWLDRMAGNISQEQLFIILRRIRRKFGGAIYDVRSADRGD